MFFSAQDTTPLERSMFHIIKHSLDRMITVCELNSFFSEFNLETSLPFYFVKHLEQDVFSFILACRGFLKKWKLFSWQRNSLLV